MLLQNFNPINIGRKVDTDDEQLMITFLWEVCVPNDLTTEIYKSPNYQILADPKLTYQKANQIVKNWIQTTNEQELSRKISENFKNIHFIYSLLYPKVYTRINQFGIKNKGDFDLAFTLYKIQKQTQTDTKQRSIKSFFTGKNPIDYKKRDEVNVNEQKPIQIDENDQNKKWTLEQKPKPKLPTIRGKSKDLKPRNYNEQKANLKRKLEENTEKLEALKNIKKNFQRKTIVLK